MLQRVLSPGDVGIARQSGGVVVCVGFLPSDDEELLLFVIAGETSARPRLYRMVRGWSKATCGVAWRA